MHPYRQILSDFRHKRLLILGDIILDRYTWGDIGRISPDAPVMIVRADKNEVRLGGAASVARLTRTLEADVALAGVVGNDPDGTLCHTLLSDATIDAQMVVCDHQRPTTSKERIIGRAENRHPQQVLRVDREVIHPIGPAIEDALIRNVLRRIEEFDAVVVSDYAKGVCSPQLLKRLITASNQRNIPIIIDPARHCSYERYYGATILTPNRAEASFLLNSQLSNVSDALPAANRLRTTLNLHAAVITLDRDGIALDSADGVSQIFRTRPREVYDATGAGDMVVSVVALCQALGVALETTMRLANAAAGVEVERFGVSPVTAQDIVTELSRDRLPSSVDKIVSVGDMATIIECHRAGGATVVLTNGCFDLLHIGHITFLEEARRLGDLLVVAVNSDKSIRRLKGDDRPVISENDRAAILASLSCVDYVVHFDDVTPNALLRLLRPDALVKGGTYTLDEVIGREIVESYGGKVFVTGSTNRVSTSAIIEIVKAR